MTTIGSSAAVGQRERPGRPHGRRSPRHRRAPSSRSCCSGACCFSLAVLFVLVVDVLGKAVPVFAERGVGLPDQPAVLEPGQGRRGRRASSARRSSAVIVALLAFPIGLATADLPRGVRERHPADPLHPDQHPQPRGRPVGRLRPAGPLGLRRLLVAAGRQRHRAQHRRGRPDARGPGAADRDHHLDRGPARRAQHDPRGRLRRGRVALGGDAPARPPVRGPRHPDRDGARAVARTRRDRAAHPRRAPSSGRSRGCPSRRCSPASYTALPMIVYDWSRKPQEAFRADAAAAIVVLLVDHARSRT